MSWKGVKQGLTFCFPPLSSIHRGRHHPFSHQCPLPPRGCTITLQNQEGPPSQEQPLTKTPEATVRWIPVSHLGHQDLTQAHSRKSAICTVNRPHSQDRTTAPDLPPSSRYKPGDAARRQGRGDLTSSPQGCARGFGQKAPGAFLLVTKPSPLHSLVPVFCSTWRSVTRLLASALCSQACCAQPDLPHSNRRRSALRPDLCCHHPLLRRGPSGGNMSGLGSPALDILASCCV